jgi:drug/metabolite transporter (DMT)-like permease
MRFKNGGEGAGLAAMAACAFLWSLAGLFIKLVDWNPFAIACGRSLVASLFILACLGKPRFTFSRLQVGAALASAATMLLFIYANKATSSANAILLQYGAPVYTALIGLVLLKERPRAEQWLALVAVLGGMLLFFMDSLGGGHLAGDLAAAGSGIAFALYIVLMRAQKAGSPLESTFLAHLMTAAIAFVFALFLPAPRLTGGAVAAMLGLGLLQIGLASVLFSYGIKRVTAIQGVIVAGIEPVLNPLWVFLATGEAPRGKTLAGGCVIIAAVLASSIVTARRDAAKRA